MVLKKIKKYFLNLLYGLPFGMKAADTEIMGGKTVSIGNTSISQEVNDQRIGKHLLKGEVTQEVEELRYRTYKVSNESEKYKYLGNGVAVKEFENKKHEKTKHQFTQENELITQTVLETLKQVGSSGVEQYRFEVDYKEFVRFKVERFVTMIDVFIDDTTGTIETTLHFSTEPNPYDAVSMPFINEIKKLLTLRNEYEISRNEIASSIDNLSFTTYKANGEDNFVNYCFINGAKFKNAKDNGHEILVTFAWDEYLRVPLNLEAKYYSKEMAEKYANKEKKETDISLVNAERKAYCSVCGKEMSIYDADIQRADGGDPICQECLQKTLRDK